MSQVQVEAVDRDQWLALAMQFRDHNYRQCWDYGQLLAHRRKAASHHVCIRRAAEVIGLADVRIKRAPFLGGIAYISGGPLVRKKDAVSGDANRADVDRLAICLDALRQHYVKAEGLVLRIQGTLGDCNWNQSAADCFVRHGFKASRSGREYRTLVVDLARPLPEIRAGFAQKWRNCLNKAQRFNPPMRVTQAINDFRRFAVLFDQFAGRKGFTADLDAAFFGRLQERLPPAEALTLTVIEANGNLVAGHLSTVLGDTCVYLLGASTEDALKTNAAYLLQWHVMTRAQAQGVRWYDLGGIDPQGNPGVYHFKCGLGGIDMRAPGPYELVPEAFGARLLLQAERTIRRWRGRKQASSVTPEAGRPMVPDLKVPG